MKVDMRRADQGLKGSARAVKKVFTQIRDNRHVDLKAMEQIITPLIDSIIENHKAVAALLRMREKKKYSYDAMHLAIVRKRARLLRGFAGPRRSEGNPFQRLTRGDVHPGDRHIPNGLHCRTEHGRGWHHRRP
jgi:hypothetical protein|tara:strand:- start:3540 stop:3938 length:399 start_codon:yes stop_codon:yes gene_type:complete